MKRRLLVLATILTMALGSVTSVHAAEISSNLTPEQKAVIESLDNTVTKVSKIETPATKSGSPRATLWRGSLYRGSFLLWSEDFIEWTSSNGRVTGSTAWQDVGYIFPNVARANGIYKQYSTSSSVTYRGDKTFGAGILTDWGDLTLVETNYSDTITAYANGDISSY